MLNAALRNKLERPEYRLLYDLGFRLTDPSFRQIITNAVQAVRKNIRNHPGCKGRDPLQFKLEQYGNKGNWALAEIKRLEKVIYDESKRPSDDFKGMWRSIEFECIFTSEDAVDAFVKDVRRQGLAKFVTVKKDNSLRVDEEDDPKHSGKQSKAVCKEVCVMYKAGDEHIVRKVCAAMDSPELRATAEGRRAYVNNTCGTHVHYDMRVVPGATTTAEIEKQVKNYGARLARCVPALKMLLPKSRRNNQFCLNVINDIPKAGQPLPPPNQIDKERYVFINLKSYRRFETIEVRGHSGTLNADKILNWIALCDKIMTTRIRHKSETHEIRNPLDLIKIYKLDEKLANYVTERFVTFNTAREREMFATPAVGVKPWQGEMAEKIAQDAPWEP